VTSLGSLNLETSRYFKVNAGQEGVGYMSINTDDLHSEPWYTRTKMHSSATMYLYARMSVVMAVAHILWPQLLPGFAGQRAQLIIHDYTPTPS